MRLNDKLLFKLKNNGEFLLKDFLLKDKLVSDLSVSKDQVELHAQLISTILYLQDWFIIMRTA